MIVMRLKLDNFLLFNDFEINMSYPKKIVDSYISEEHLENHPNFRYKKLIVLMGANATGKTALGRVLMGIFNFIERKEYRAITTFIEDSGKSAYFEMDFVTDGKYLYRITANISPLVKESYDSNDIHVCVKKRLIRSTDNYEKCSARLDSDIAEYSSNYILELEKIPSITWVFEYPFASGEKQKIVNPVNNKLYQDCLKQVLHVLDPRITDVVEVKQSKNTYIIIRNGDSIIIDNGQIKSPEQLSSGTLEGIGVASMITSMKLHASRFYYCDEKFSHIHSEVEKAFLSLMIDYLGPNEQMIFTTHNSDVLDMDLPVHSYAFMRRKEYDNNAISCIYASDYIKKNDVSLKAAVDNDIFSANPDVAEVFNIY